MTSRLVGSIVGLSMLVALALSFAALRRIENVLTRAVPKWELAQERVAEPAAPPPDVTLVPRVSSGMAISAGWGNSVADGVNGLEARVRELETSCVRSAR